MSAKEVSFEGTRGRRLSGHLELPLDGRPVAFALFAHCFTRPEEFQAVADIGRALCREGIAVLCLPFAGLDERGDGSDDAHLREVDDLIAAAEYLAEHHEAPRVLVGHSLGGAAVLGAAEHVASAVAVATIGAPASCTQVERLPTAAPDRSEADGVAEVKLGERRIRVRRELLEGLEPHRLQEVIRTLRRPLLILHSPRDEVVGIASAAEIFQAALHPKSFVSLDRADHFLSDAHDSRYAGSMIAAWAARYIETPVAATVEELLAERGVATRTGSEGYRTEIRARHHAWVADEPASVGGADTGPTPYELLAAALGTCTTMTLRMYADRKGWPVEEATVWLRHRRVHALDEEQCEHRAPRLDQLERVVEVRGPLSAEQRARLMEIADRCPVHRTLEAGVRIVTRAAEAADTADSS